MVELAAHIDEFQRGSDCPSVSHRAWLLVSICLAHRLDYVMSLIPCEGEAAVHYQRACEIVKTAGHACISRNQLLPMTAALVAAPARFGGGHLRPPSQPIADAYYVATYQDHVATLPGIAIALGRPITTVSGRPAAERAIERLRLLGIDAAAHNGARLCSWRTRLLRRHTLGYCVCATVSHT